MKLVINVSRKIRGKRAEIDNHIPKDFTRKDCVGEVAGVQFNRAIEDEDAISLDINTIDTGNATKSLVCSAIYARFQRKDKSYSCQLIFSRSKLAPEGMTLPRAELCAASLNASTGHVVKLALGDLHKECIKLTDSQIALHKKSFKTMGQV